MNGAVPDKLHWLSLMNSAVVIIVLTSFFVTRLVKHLRPDLAPGYSALTTTEEDGATNSHEQGQGAWIRACNHMFEPPVERPKLLAVACGTGAQICVATFVTLAFCCLGWLSPARRGAMLTAMILLFVLNGAVNGYATARLYKTFKGDDISRATGMAATLFPSIAFGVLLIVNVLAWCQDSTDSVPIFTLGVLCFLWAVVNVPLVFLGAHCGGKAGVLVDIQLQGASNLDARAPVPAQPWSLSLPCVFIVGGILPFAALYMELYSILASVWREYYYSTYGFLFLALTASIITLVEVSLVMMMFQLRHGNYRWWWRSFGIGGSSAAWVFMYSWVYFQQLEASSVAAHMFFGYMTLACLGLGCMMGFISVASTLWFNRALFALLQAKLDSGMLSCDELLPESNELENYHALQVEMK